MSLNDALCGGDDFYAWATGLSQGALAVVQIWRRAVRSLARVAVLVTVEALWARRVESDLGEGDSSSSAQSPLPASIKLTIGEDHAAAVVMTRHVFLRSRWAMTKFGLQPQVKLTCVVNVEEHVG